MYFYHCPYIRVSIQAGSSQANGYLLLPFEFCFALDSNLLVSIVIRNDNFFHHIQYYIKHNAVSNEF